MGFVQHALFKGARFRILSVADNYTLPKRMPVDIRLGSVGLWLQPEANASHYGDGIGIANNVLSEQLC
jgi:hypothetical protein